MVEEAAQVTAVTQGLAAIEKVSCGLAGWHEVAQCYSQSNLLVF